MKYNGTVPVEHVLSVARWISRLAYAIALIGVIASYATQVVLLLAHGVGGFSYVLPATVDILAICATMALQLPGLDKGSRKLAGWILFVAMSVSVTANMIGEHDSVARASHGWPIVAYLLGELLANRVRSYAARVTAEQRETAPAIEMAELTSSDLPQAPTSPAVISAAPTEAPKSPVRTPRDPYGPRGGKKDYSDRHARRPEVKARTEAAGK